MVIRLLKSFALSIVFFCTALISLIVAFNGDSFAIAISRPYGAASWGTSGNLIDAYTYIPMFLGVYFLLLSSITFTVPYIKLHKKPM
ncbi:hypothetical protein [Planococcus sp. SSTMD024]|uniref:hypothetical protein n=1 Tax=Planococcus sp. SSTMD024 TaxID=3242163 RepID=UPI00351F62BD